MTFADQFGMENDVAWFEGQMEGSGLTKDIVDTAQIKLVPGGYQIPYFDMQGRLTPQVQQRQRAGETRYFRAEGDGINRLYWTPTIKHEMHDLTIPLFIVEGEKKALCLQSHLLGHSIRGSVVGLSGVSMWDALVTNPIPMSLTKPETRRPVYLIFDFNSPKSKSNANTRWEETKLSRALNNMGADVKLVRWRGEGEQKIDDYLVAGGLWHDVELSTPEEFAYSHQYFNDHYAKYHGDVVRLADAFIYTTHQFRNAYSDKNTLVGKKKVMHTTEWLDWSYVPKIKEIIFQPRATGEYPEVIDGRLNRWHGWDVQGVEGNVEPWVDLLDHLGLDDWARCWLAHIFQKPWEQPANYLAIFSPQQGCGKGLLVETLQGLLGMYWTKGSEELWLDKFNAALAHNLLVISDELVMLRVNEQNRLKAKIKEICGNDKLVVRAMRTDAVVMDNFTRLIFTGNNENLVYIDQADRRAACYKIDKLYGPARGTEYIKWMKANTGAIMHWLQAYDISAWSAKDRAPESSAKVEVREASMSGIEYFASWVKEQQETADVMTATELMAWYEQVVGERWHSSHTFTRKLRSLGVISKTVMAGDSMRLFAVRRVEMYNNAEAVVFTTVYKKKGKYAL